MTASRLADVVREIAGAELVDGARADVLVTGVHHDSRAVEPGDLFVARPGGHVDGARFVADAVARGAVAVVATRGAAIDAGSAAVVLVDDAARALAYAAAAVYGHPTFALDVIGITGTNGKTTTSYLVKAAIDVAGGRTGLVGTLGYRFDDLDVAATHTSPEADELARVAAAMVARGATHLAMEVSSIALAAKRVEAVRFRVAAFSNLTQDHLDYHGTMEAYGEAKARLFLELDPGAAVVNVDDAFGAALARRFASVEHQGPASKRDRGRSPLVRVSSKVGALAAQADISLLSISTGAFGVELDARTPAGLVHVRSPLLGMHNVANLLCAIGIAHALDLDVARAAEGLSRPIAVPGRLERVDDPARDDVAVLVDYAHTPDALARVLDGVRATSRGRLICVFGCGGDRDPKKRPLMGEAVGARADVAVVTNDNPRSEAPRAIVDAILPGLAGSRAEVLVELDRRAAIELGVARASAGDVVLVAGKGHEPYQIVGAETFAFDDRDEARLALARRRERRVREER